MGTGAHCGETYHVVPGDDFNFAIILGGIQTAPAATIRRSWITENGSEQGGNDEHAICSGMGCVNIACGYQMAALTEVPPRSKSRLSLCCPVGTTPRVSLVET